MIHRGTRIPTYVNAGVGIHGGGGVDDGGGVPVHRCWC